MLGNYSDSEESVESEDEIEEVAPDEIVYEERECEVIPSYTRRLLSKVRPAKELQAQRQAYLKSKRAQKHAEERRAKERAEQLRLERETYLEKDEFLSTPCPRGGRRVPDWCSMTRQQAYELEKRLGLR